MNTTGVDKVVIIFLMVFDGIYLIYYIPWHHILFIEADKILSSSCRLDTHFVRGSHPPLACRMLRFEGYLEEELATGEKKSRRRVCKSTSQSMRL